VGPAIVFEAGVDVHELAPAGWVAPEREVTRVRCRLGAGEIGVPFARALGRPRGVGVLGASHHAFGVIGGPADGVLLGGA